jgi:hypothetical protein
MKIGEGDRLRYKFAEQFYTVKIFKNGTFVLESEDTTDTVWIGDRDLDLFFETAEKK